MLIRKDLMTKHNIDIKTRQQIDELYQSGETLKNISIITHYSFPVLTRILKEDGLYSPKYKRWTDSEINFLRSEYGEASWDTLLQHLSRWTKSDIIQKASDLHLKRNIYFWTDHDIQILKNNYHTQGDVHIVYMLLQKKFSIPSIYRKASELQLSTRNFWTHEENLLLQQSYGVSTLDDICKLLPARSRKAIISHALQLGLENKIIWKDEEIQYLKDNYKIMNDTEIGKILNRPAGGIQMKRIQLGLLKVIFENKYPNINKYLRRNNQKWRHDSITQCLNQCVVTGEYTNEVHHLYGMNFIVAEAMQSLGYETDVEVTDLSQEELKDIHSTFLNFQNKYPLGVCLSHDIHVQFHTKYGYGNNTPEQFQDFLKEYNYKTA